MAPVVEKGSPPHRPGAELAAPLGHEAAQQDTAHQLGHHGKDEGIELGEVELGHHEGHGDGASIRQLT